MPVSRRQLLRDGARVAAALSVGPMLLRFRSCRRASPLQRAARAPGDGGLCSSRVNDAAVHAAPAHVAQPLHAETLARFVDRLPIPSTLAPDGMRPDPVDPRSSLPYYRIAMRQIDQRVHRDLPPSTFWSYGGHVPGPTLETRSEQAFLVEWVNELPADHFLPIDHTLHGAHADQPRVRAVVHVHGAKVPPESDGHPEAWITPGQSAVYRYPNRQDAAMLWYHDHTMGIERLNQYAGLFGALFVRDAVEDRLGLPKGPHEIPLVLCDRIFRADGQLEYPTSGDPETPWVPEVYGDTTLVNGVLFPYLEVEPVVYRFRVLNASNARLFYLSRSDRGALYRIGSDQGLLPAPVPATTVTLAPAERADVLVDFRSAAGRTLVLRNQVAELLQFRVASRAERASAAIPTRLRSVERMPEGIAVKTRTLTLREYQDAKRRRMLMLLDGKYWRDPVSEQPTLGAVEIWSFVNLTEDTHPIHLHLVRFQILDRQLFDADEFLTSGKMILIGQRLPPDGGEAGWKDTVRVDPGTVTRIIARFDGYAGAYVWHCHLLEHAANEMMRPFEVVQPT